MATKTLQTKQSSEWTNDAGETFAAQTLYRFVDENGEGGCWFASIERAEASWALWTAGAAQREARRAATARYRAEAAAFAAAERSTDPFAGL